MSSTHCFQFLGQNYFLVFYPAVGFWLLPATEFIRDSSGMRQDSSAIFPENRAAMTGIYLGLWGREKGDLIEDWLIRFEVSWQTTGDWLEQFGGFSQVSWNGVNTLCWDVMGVVGIVGYGLGFSTGIHGRIWHGGCVSGLFYGQGEEWWLVASGRVCEDALEGCLKDGMRNALGRRWWGLSKRWR